MQILKTKKLKLIKIQIHKSIKKKMSKILQLSDNFLQNPLSAPPLCLLSPASCLCNSPVFYFLQNFN